MRSSAAAASRAWRTASRTAVFSNEDQYLEWAAALIAEAVKTNEYAVVAQSELAPSADLHAPILADLLPPSNSSPKWNWAEVVIPVRRGQEDVQLILLGRRHGGQRYFSEDLEVLRRAGMEIAERVEALRRQEMNRLVSQAELRALQSQINPHLFFNALNTLYGTIPREAAGARRMVINLADIFRLLSANRQDFCAARAGDASIPSVSRGRATEAWRSFDRRVPRG